MNRMSRKQKSSFKMITRFLVHRLLFYLIKECSREKKHFLTGCIGINGKPVPF
ncbi:hypothetical protein O3M35_000774 [Rhynocoris fuscipes]|uniref:Uncharacterized protein n=1 Tax=Rhynocoris fuscipes TaxID=488301 RepID=A0AAW1DNJ7_9HEMI